MDIEKAKQIDGWMTEKELEWLAKTAQTKFTILEIGSWHGRSTRALADNTVGYVIAVDHFNGSRNEQDSGHASARDQGGDDALIKFAENMFDKLMTGKVVAIRGNSENVLSLLASKGFKVEMVFIDGGHSYEEVRYDIKMAMKLTGPNTIVCGHDYCDAWPGVKRAVAEAFGDDFLIGKDTTIWYTIL